MIPVKKTVVFLTVKQTLRKSQKCVAKSGNFRGRQVNANKIILT